MKILYLEDRKDIETFIKQLSQLSDPFTINPIVQKYGTDMVLMPVIDYEILENKIDLESKDDTTLGLLTFNTHTNRVVYDGKEVELLKKEFDILMALVNSFPRLALKEMIILKVWPDYSGPLSNSIEVHVARLRKKLGKKSITCIKGFGYKLNVT